MSNDRVILHNARDWNLLDIGALEALLPLATQLGYQVTLDHSGTLVLRQVLNIRSAPNHWLASFRVQFINPAFERFPAWIPQRLQCERYAAIVVEEMLNRYLLLLGGVSLR